MKWKKKMKPNKQEKTKNTCEESFRSLRVSLPVNASTSAASQWGLPFQTLPNRIRPVALAENNSLEATHGGANNSRKNTEIKVINPFYQVYSYHNLKPRTAASFFYILFRRCESSDVTYPLGSVFSGPGAFGNVRYSRGRLGDSEKQRKSMKKKHSPKIRKNFNCRRSLMLLGKFNLSPTCS